MNLENENEPAKGSSFLQIDFTQCFEQMRHYDQMQMALLKFAYTGYTAIVSGSYILLKIGETKEMSFTPVIVLLLLVSFLIGLIVSSIFIRNRYYFVVVSRHVNELRDMFSGDKFLTSKSKSGISKEFGKTSYWNPFSSHMLAFYLLSVLNSSLFAGAVYIIGISAYHILLVAILILLALSLCQIVIARSYLKSKEKKPEGKVQE